MEIVLFLLNCSFYIFLCLYMSMFNYVMDNETFTVLFTVSADSCLIRPRTSINLPFITRLHKKPQHFQKPKSNFIFYLKKFFELWLLIFHCLILRSFSLIMLFNNVSNCQLLKFSFLKSKNYAPLDL